MIKKYRNKPVIVETILYDGKNDDEVLAFGKGEILITSQDKSGKTCLGIWVGERTQKINIGDYIVKADCEIITCSSDIFNKTYEVME